MGMSSRDKNVRLEMVKMYIQCGQAWNMLCQMCDVCVDNIENAPILLLCVRTVAQTLL